MKKITRFITHLVFRPNQFKKKQIKRFASLVRDKKILEIGSGKTEGGKYYYSCKPYFDESNEFIQSDINPDFGHKVVDVTNMDYDQEFDVILFTNVLEHVFDYQKAIDSLYKAVKEEGTLVVMIPGLYPLHDEPHDYWRFTEHALRKIFNKFGEVKLKHSGIRQFPFAYYIEARK